MPGLQGESVVAALGSPIKKSKLSLKFFQKKDTKRALDFSEPQADEAKTAEPVEPEARWVSVCDAFEGGVTQSSQQCFITLPCGRKMCLVGMFVQKTH